MHRGLEALFKNVNISGNRFFYVVNAQHLFYTGLDVLAAIMPGTNIREKKLFALIGKVLVIGCAGAIYGYFDIPINAIH